MYEGTASYIRAHARCRDTPGTRASSDRQLGGSRVLARMNEIPRSLADGFLSDQVTLTQMPKRVRLDDKTLGVEASRSRWDAFIVFE
jgi:hypothetical protein